MKRWIPLVAVLLIAGGVWAADEPPIVDWVRTHAIKLQTVEAGHGFDDMQALQKVVGDARIVSLGEATHGTREFFQLKHRMLEFLATQMGFTIFSIEANMPESYKLNDYVLNGTGDPARLIAGMYFWTWNTQEVLDMVQWMREFNKSGKGRVQFTGFDMQTPDVARQIVRDFVAQRDPEYVADLAKAIDLTKDVQAPGPRFGGANGALPVAAAAGKKLHISGWVKAEKVDEGFASMWLRVDGKSGPLAFNTTEERDPAKGTQDWRKWDVEVPVAENASGIYFGVLLHGSGTVWFDSLAVDLDGKPYVDDHMDLDFESPSLVGFYPVAGAYQVQLDSQQFHTGKQSLRVRNTRPEPKGTDAKVSSAAWKDVVRHLEASREAYLKKEATAREIEWAIQNARVVLQAMQLKANEVARDLSMAENVKWILDQNPGAKVVLWAHNGHVSTAGGFEPMGAHLRKMFGDRMVTFGFSFNEGSFQAVEMGKSLHDFTVAPAADASLDRTFAATGIPLFALDLRAAPKSGPVAEWLNAPQKTRSIGSMYTDNAAAQYVMPIVAPKAFDVMLFVEKTTAARGNPRLPAQ